MDSHPSRLYSSSASDTPIVEVQTRTPCERDTRRVVGFVSGNPTITTDERFSSRQRFNTNGIGTFKHNNYGNNRLHYNNERIRRNTSPSCLAKGYQLVIPDDDDDVPLIDVTEIDIDARLRNHCHSDVLSSSRSHVENLRAQRQLLAVCAICLTFMSVEIAGGAISGSLAIMTDAAHLLSDFGGFCISLFALWVARKPATVRMSFGYYRAEVMGAVLSVLVIWVLTGVLIYLAVLRVINKNYEIEPDIMLITAGIGIFINIVLITILYYTGHGHTHSHGGSSNHSHNQSESDADDESKKTMGQKRNLNVRAAMIHCIGDFIQSIGVFAAAILIKFGGKKFYIADPVCTFVFSVIVLITTLTILRDAVHVLMEGVPKNIDYNALRTELGSIEGVCMAHGLHVWSLTTSCIALAVHLAVDEGSNKQEVLNIASERVRNKFNIQYSTIQVEEYQAEIMSQCSRCNGPS